MMVARNFSNKYLIFYYLFTELLLCIVSNMVYERAHTT